MRPPRRFINSEKSVGKEEETALRGSRFNITIKRAKEGALELARLTTAGQNRADVTGDYELKLCMMETDSHWLDDPTFALGAENGPQP
jgi:hypothetical protein